MAGVSSEFTCTHARFINTWGKRWRALSTVLLGLTYGLSLETLLDLAVLVEIPHNASLIVDDIEDKSSVRRGESAVHLIYGEDNAINSANFGYFYPWLPWIRWS